MSKLPKNLSSIRARSSSLSTRTLDWSKRTSERSGSSIIAAMMKSGPRQPENRKTTDKVLFEHENGQLKLGANGRPIPKAPLESKIDIIIARIKREEIRIKKMKAMGTPPVGRETRDDQDRAAKILRKEQIVTRLMFTLQTLNGEKQRLDAREEHKRLNREAQQDGLMVRIRDDKFVPVRENNLVPHRNYAMRGAPRQSLRDETRLVKIEKAESDAKQRIERKEKLKRLTMADLVRKEAVERKQEKEKREEEFEKKKKEFFSDDDFEKMFE